MCFFIKHPEKHVLHGSGVHNYRELRYFSRRGYRERRKWSVLNNIRRIRNTFLRTVHSYIQRRKIKTRLPAGRWFSPSRWTCMVLRSVVKAWPNSVYTRGFPYVSSQLILTFFYNDGITSAVAFPRPPPASVSLLVHYYGNVPELEPRPSDFSAAFF